MSQKVEMIVSLKVPDTTAITALQTLKKIGFNKIKDVKRADYYRFFVDGDAKKFMEKASNVDLLANANKHSCSFLIPKDNNVKILVKNINNEGSGILSVLSSRLGFKNIQKMEKATLWSLDIEADAKEAAKIAAEATKELLANEHYQEYEIF